MLTADRLRELLAYDPDTGVFTWRADVRSGRGRKVQVAAGDVAGTASPKGYVLIRIDGKAYMAHRLAFLYMTGKWPDPEADHENGVRSDNRWANLREATRLQNCQNKKARHDSTTGLKGVSPRKGRFQARIQVDGNRKSLGLFATAEEAHAAYCKAAVEAFGEFAGDDVQLIAEGVDK